MITRSSTKQHRKITVTVAQPATFTRQQMTMNSRLRHNFTINYPDEVVNQYVKPLIDSPVARFGPAKCRLVLRLLWYGPPSRLLEKVIRKLVSSTYYAVSVNVVFQTRRLFRGYKDVLPTPQLSNIIYQFECRACEARYVGGRPNILVIV